MTFNCQLYSGWFVNKTPEGNERTRNAQEQYEVNIVAANVSEGETYWKAIGVHHLLPEENQSNHNVFLEALDEAGHRVQAPCALAGWTWKDKKPGEHVNPVVLDKPLSEPAGNIAVFPPQKIAVWIQGLPQGPEAKSDHVENLHTMHDDECGPKGEIWNSYGHHSFYVVFQRTRKGADIKGTISGQVVNGKGYRVRLWQGNNVVADQVVDEHQAFKFEGVPAGTYRLEATGPSLHQENLNISATNRDITVTLTAPSS
jgi:hypothetical protein